MMAEPFETLREVGVALDGFRADVLGQFSTLKWIIGGVTAAGLAAGGLMFSKIDALEDAAARNTAILERIESAIDRTAMNTDSIMDAVQSASVAPEAPGSEVFPGWSGVPLAEFGTIEAFSAKFAPDGKLNDGWVYFQD